MFYPWNLIFPRNPWSPSIISSSFSIASVVLMLVCPVRGHNFVSESFYTLAWVIGLNARFPPNLEDQVICLEIPSPRPAAFTSAIVRPRCVRSKRKQSPSLMLLHSGRSLGKRKSACFIRLQWVRWVPRIFPVHFHVLWSEVLSSLR